MPESIEETLHDIDAWFNELPGGNERPIFLSKLAILELCGWLEYRIDILVDRAGKQCGLDTEWLKEKVIEPNYGFSYSYHLRPMLVKLSGESGIKTLEKTLEAEPIAILDPLKSELNSLWGIRVRLAHTDLATPVKIQPTINAPSWSINRQRVIAKVLNLFEKKVIDLNNTSGTS